MVYNPTDRRIVTILSLPLYYTGLTGKARIREQEGGAVEYMLDRQYRVEVPVRIGPKAITWFVVESGDGTMNTDQKTRRGEIR